MKRYFLIFAVVFFTILSCNNGVNASKENGNISQNEDVDTVKISSDCLPLMCYAISNRLGTRFLLMGQSSNYADEQLNDLCYAIYSTKVYKVKYSGKQEGDKDTDTGRDTWMNFDNMSGYVFDNIDEALITQPKDDYCGVWGPVILCNEEFLKMNKLLPFKSMLKLPEDELSKAFEDKYGRKILNSKVSFVFGENFENKFCSIQFVNEGNQALGVYAICTEDDIYYLDFPQTITEDNEYSLWRVDDGGDFFLENTPVAIFATSEGIIFKMQDIGFEGYNCYTIKLQNGKVEKLKTEFSAYTAPM